MRRLNNKYIIMAALILGISALGVGFMKNREPAGQTLRIGFPEYQSALKYEPTRIHMAYEYIFLENVFSPLIEVHQKGELSPGVAEKADWIGNELRLTVRKDLKTVSGRPITSRDVVFSLKRLLVLSGNTHGNFKDLICPGAEMKSVQDDCPGIREENGFVFLNPKERKPFLIPMLAAIDFAIIPESSCDPKTLAITDMNETSGPYYVAKDDPNGNVILKLNPNHYNARPDIPQEIEFVPIRAKTPEESLNALEDGRIDHLTTVDVAKVDNFLRFAETHPDFSVHTTLKIRTLAVVFTPKGQKEFSPSERFYLGEKLANVFSGVYEEYRGYERREEFFPNLGEGGLTSEQEAELTRVKSKPTTKPHREMVLGLMKRGSIDQWQKPIEAALPFVKCRYEKIPPDLNKDLAESDFPDAYVVSTDSGFLEDISLISYSLNAGFLGIEKQNREKWLADYMATPEKKDRVQKLKKLHFDALTNPVIIPLLASPYGAIVRKPWKFELSDLYANNPLWLIKTK